MREIGVTEAEADRVWADVFNKIERHGRELEFKWQLRVVLGSDRCPTYAGEYLKRVMSSHSLWSVWSPRLCKGA